MSRSVHSPANGHPPLHPSALASSTQAHVEEMMDQQHFAPPPSNNNAATATAQGPRILSNLHPILTNNLRSGPSHMPSSPVSPMLSAHDLPHSAPLSAAQAQQSSLSTKAFLSVLHHSTNHTGATTTTPNPATTTAAATTPKTGNNRDDEAMAQRTPISSDPRPVPRELLTQQQQEEEMMSQEEEDAFGGAAGAGGLQAAASAEYDPNLAPLSAEELEQFQAEELAAQQWMDGTEFDEPQQQEDLDAAPTATLDAEGNPIPSPAPATPSATLTREEKVALEEKTKLRKKAAEMRYLVNSMFRCADCMKPPDMELGFDSHAPPRRPAARPSAGPGSNYCCVGPALADALPPDYPLDLVPLTHSYLLSDAPSRSFLTTPPLPAQGTIQCYILKTNTKFELYLEMKNQPDFMQMRSDKERAERETQQKAEDKARRAAGLPTLAEEKEEMDRKRAQALAAAEEAGGFPHDGLDQEMNMAADAAGPPPLVAASSISASSSSASSSALPGLPPSLLQSQSLPLMPLPVTSLDDSEQAVDRGAMSVAETPDVPSPSHCIDYEKLFPEQPLAPKQPLKRVARSANTTPILRPQQAPACSFQQLHKMAGSGRRMSEPALGMFSLGPGLASASSSAHNSPLLHRRALHQQQQQQQFASSISSTPASQSRRLSAASSVAAAAAGSNSPPMLPVSASNLHLHQTRSNAINSMLKHHAESIIAEGKDIFLLCAQRKRSWTGNHYLISSDRDQIRADGPHFLGKLKSNFGGTEFTAYDNGAKSPSRKNMETLQKTMYPTYHGPSAMRGGAATSKMEASPKSASGISGLGLGMAASASSTMSSWLSGSMGGGSHSSGSSNNPPHVRHELACVLYDHFFEHSGSPIRIKVLLPNRAFDLVAEAQVGGSIIKQYKQETDRAEKARAEAEAKLALANEAKRVAEASAALAAAKENSASHASFSEAENASMMDAESNAPPTPAAAAAAAAASSSSSSSSSASVAPLLEGVAAEDPSAKSSVDTYENLRPVWHDGMNAYVLHFDQHRVREKSVKNFIIKRTIPDPSPSAAPGATIQKTVLQFGRVLDRSIFIMDYGYPLSAVAAFAICLSSIDPKLAV